MRRLKSSTILLGLLLVAIAAFAGNPHFINVDVTRNDGSITVSGKEAGLGNETDVHIEATADALCINPGSHHPKADNKEGLAAGGDFPVQNGKAEFSLELEANISPPCDPPMTLVFTNIEVCDTEHDVCKKISGTF